jgi:hypothetical protein
MQNGLHAKYTLLLSHFNETNFPDNVRKISKCQISMKSVQWEQSCYTRTNGRAGGSTDEVYSCRVEQATWMTTDNEMERGRPSAVAV